jgi:hypothetical protein
MRRYDHLPKEVGATDRANLYRVYRNLHPFSIDFSVKWEAFHPDHKDGIDVTRGELGELRAKFETHRKKSMVVNIITITLAILSFLVAIGSILVKVVFNLEL